MLIQYYLKAMKTVKKAAVLGAGTMGSQIAAHLANARIPTLLLDIAPRELTADEQAKGLTLESADVRNRIARGGFEAAKKARPAAFFTSDLASLITIGNFDDDLPKLKDCDLIIEAVVENLEIKRSLYETVEQYRRPGSVLASNTSGIPLKQLAEGRPEDFREHFLGLHFFNPPRYMHLVELIRTEWTKPEVSCSMFGFLDERLGKGVVVAKDRPNFIANRIGTFGALVTMRTMLDDSYTIEEVDKITGPAVGRPKTATFRTFDLVGLDVFVWKTTMRTLCYAAERIPEIADSIVEVDHAMQWGFNWELGPFEVWDAIGVEKSAAKLKEEGRSVPAKVQQMLAAGARSFYK